MNIGRASERAPARTVGADDLRRTAGSDASPGHRDHDPYTFGYAHGIALGLSLGLLIGALFL